MGSEMCIRDSLKTSGWLKKKILKKYYHRLSHIVGVSKGVVSELITIDERLINKSSCIYNGFDLDEIKRKSMAISVIDLTGYRAKYDKVILMVGRLTEQKDYKTAIKAMSKLKENGYCLLIAGDGYLKEELNDLVLDADCSNVFFLGHLDNPFPLMCQSDIFLLSSKWESFGNVIVEALALGCPVISSDCPYGPAEILESGKYGLLFDVGDVDGLVRSVLQMSANKKMMNSEILINRSLDFSTRIQVEKLEFIINNIPLIDFAS